MTSVLLAGCGGGETPSAQVRSVVERYYSALEHHDGDAACSELTTSTREAVGRALQLFPQAKLTHLIDCETLLSHVGRYSAGTKRVVTLGAVTVDGDRATVLVNYPGSPPHKASLMRTSAGWRIGRGVVGAGTARPPIQG